MDLVIADRDNVGAVYFSMNEDYVEVCAEAAMEAWARISWCGLDGNLSVNRRTSTSSFPGSFTRILGKYVRDEKLLRFEDAICKFTSLPAQRERLFQRGLIRPDFFADITIFNPDTVADVATFEKSAQISTGIEAAAAAAAGNSFEVRDTPCAPILQKACRFAGN